MKFRIISLLLILLGVSSNAEGRTDTSRVYHRLEANVRPSYIMPTHPLYTRLNSSGKPLLFSSSAHFQYSLSFSPESYLGKMYPNVYQGVGLGGYTFLDDAEIGSPLALYLFQRARIAQLSRRLSLDYEWNLGLSFGWKQNVCIASPINAYINVGLLLEYDISPRWTLSAGPEYTHFSNGDTRFPNGGANTMGLRVGVAANLSDTPEPASRVEVEAYERNLTYDVLVYGAWRADRVVDGGELYVVNERFPVAGLHFNPLYHFSRYFSAGASLDMIYDSSANLYGHTVADDGETVAGYLKPPFRNQIAAGLSLRGELTMSIFSINIGSGINFIKSGEDMKRFYTLFNLKTFVSDRLFLLIGYRFSSLQYTHNLMFGLGWRI